MNILKLLFSSPPAPLSYMKLGPDGSQDNPLMIQFFTWDAESTTTSWWKHFEDEIPTLAELGFTQVWLPPPNKAAHPKGRGYDAYDLWDLGEFEQKGTTATRWGSKEELLSACRVATEHRIDIIIDAVLNHKLGADGVEKLKVVSVDPQNRLKELERQEIEGWTIFNFPGRGNKYSALHWSQEHFTGLDWDQSTQTQGVFKIVGKGHKGWSKNVDRELGNYDYLLGVDIDHRHPEVQNDFFAWGPWVLETTGAVGFRLDAIKHIDRKFTLRFVRQVRMIATNSRMFSVAEYWSGNINAVLPYTRAFKGETAFFDVPLHMNFHHASQHYSRYDLRNIMNDSLVKNKPGHAVTFVDNHDTVEGQSLESWVGDHFKIQAYALILLRGTGYPCVFYGDLYPNSECYNENIARNLKLLIKARKLYAYGGTQDYLSSKNCIGFVRLGDSRHSGCAVILSNREDSFDTSNSDFVHSIRMNVGRSHAGSTFQSYLTTDGRVEIDAEGWGEFTCFAGSAQVWVKL
ncbi:glycoside hydrolase family 13 protein [Lentinula raphanica]|uniref:Glycoside hydrolase family 13 protein n=1 Tax=Lentinula raphanica TaxID=153919 RepID=A0AA38PAF9_9AGAR|nr:glycoside hydrolase family 13 protein [Lentinula raphanica]KAJ3839289.1 glycoside hydrolase family 13 protein [Lentinula raphanica]